MNSSTVKTAMNDIAAYLVVQLSKEQNISRDQALEQVMKTTVYAALLDPETGLYYEPKDSVYNMLREELNNHPEELLKVQ